jgi:hypothetical protein
MKNFNNFRKYLQNITVANKISRKEKAMCFLKIVYENLIAKKLFTKKIKGLDFINIYRN